jgi:protein SCO1
MQNQPTRKKNRQIVGVIIVIVVILAGLGFYSHSRQKTVAQPLTPAASKEVPEPSNQTILPTPKSISAFTLTDNSGKPFTNENLKGHWTFVFFGFSHCGDVCPLTLAELNKMDQQLQKDLPTDQLPQVVFVTVDPERDTVEVLDKYVKNFNPRFLGATGNAENLNVFVKDLGMSYAKNPPQDAKDPNTYGMSHSSQIYLINPEGNWAGVITYPFQADQLVKNYKALISSPKV